MANIPGLSTLGVRLYYGIEETAGQKPTTWVALSRVNAIGGISVDVETIDASALEDLTTKSVAGRGDLGGNFPITINVTQDTVDELQTMIQAYKSAKAQQRQTWFEIYHPDMAEKGAFFVKAEPPMVLPVPETSQNELWTIELNMTINELVGLDTAVIPS